jgi:hypothetical protein
MEITTNLTTLELHNNDIATISPDQLEGWSLDLLRLNKNPLTSLPPELFTITKTLELKDITFLGFDTIHWNEALCSEGSYGLEELHLTGSMDTITEFPEMAATLCRHTTPLVINLQYVSKQRH